MNITLTKEEFKKLPDEAQTAIINLLTESSSLSEENLTTVRTTCGAVGANLSLYQVERFMSGVSDFTKDNIELLVSNEGHMTLDEFKDKTKIKNTAAGFFTPITKRVRTILGIKDAHLIVWDDDCGEKRFRISPNTLEAFKEFFAQS